MSTRTTVRVGVLCTALIVLAACGSSNDSSANTAEKTRTTEAVAEALWRLDATDAEVAETEKLIRDTQAAVAKYGSVAEAEADGFVRINNDHLLIVERVFDDKLLDPDTIESLVVGQRDGVDYIRGGMYLMNLGDMQADVPPFGGPLVVWHGHGGFCFRANGVIANRDEVTGECEAGSGFLDDPPMVHVYNDPQMDGDVVRTEKNCGTFTYMDLPHHGTVPKCGKSDGRAGMPHK